MQVNIGMQFVKAGHYRQAISFLTAVLAQYRLAPIEEFCAGQIAIKEVLRLQESYQEQISICGQARLSLIMTLLTAGLPNTTTLHVPGGSAQVLPGRCITLPTLSARPDYCAAIVYTPTAPTLTSDLMNNVVFAGRPVSCAWGCAGGSRLLCHQGHQPAPHRVPFLHALQLLQPGAALHHDHRCRWRCLHSLLVSR